MNFRPLLNLVIPTTFGFATGIVFQKYNTNIFNIFLTKKVTFQQSFDDYANKKVQSYFDQFIESKETEQLFRIENDHPNSQDGWTFNYINFLLQNKEKLLSFTNVQITTNKYPYYNRIKFTRNSESLFVELSD